MKEMKRPLIGISSCLLGENVRYNKGNTQDKWITRELSKYVDFYPFCPEVEMGLGVPREEIHLVYNNKNKDEIKLISKFSKEDLTEKAHQTYLDMNKKMSNSPLDGLILMRKSPSCGLGNVKTVSHDGQGPVRLLQGLYAKNLESIYPFVPKEDSGRMKEPTLREHFIKCCFAHYRFSNIEKSIAAIQIFHKRYKYILMEHSQTKLKELGRVVANSPNKDVEEVFNSYKTLLFETLSIKATPANRYNTLLHVMGYLKKEISSDDKQELLRVFDEFKEGVSGYMTPVSLLNFLVNKYDIDYLKDQYFFNPYPKELKLQKEI